MQDRNEGPRWAIRPDGERGNHLGLPLWERLSERADRLGQSEPYFGVEDKIISANLLT